MATTRKSNFDLTGAKLVKRGHTVSYHGLRMTVSRVRMGWFWVAGYSGQLACNSVQVVA